MVLSYHPKNQKSILILGFFLKEIFYGICKQAAQTKRRTFIIRNYSRLSNISTPKNHKISRTTCQKINKTSILLVFAYYARLCTNIVYLFITPEITVYCRIIKDQANKLNANNTQNCCAK